MKTGNPLHSLLFASLTAAMVVGVSVPAAQATAVVAATEPTQILNHIELATQYENMVKRALTQAKTYIATEKQLADLPNQVKDMAQSAKNTMQSINLDNIRKAQDLVDALQSSTAAMDVLKGGAQNAYYTMEQLRAQGKKITLPQYEMGVSQLEQSNAKVYGHQIENYQAAAKQQQAAAAKIQAIYNSSGAIDSSVSGLKAIVNTNAVLGQQLANVNTSLTEMKIMQAQKAKIASMQAAQKHAQEACAPYAFQMMLLGTSTDPSKTCQKAPPAPPKG